MIYHDIIKSKSKQCMIKILITMIDIVIFCNIAPHSDSQSTKFYEHVVYVLKKEDQIYEDRIIIGGDFNCPLNPSRDKMGGLLTTRKKVVDQIENMQNIFNVHDVWRIKLQSQKSFT